MARQKKIPADPQTAKPELSGAHAKAEYEKLQAQRSALITAISTKTGDARARLQADLDRIESQIAARLAVEAN